MSLMAQMPSTSRYPVTISRNSFGKRSKLGSGMFSKGNNEKWGHEDYDRMVEIFMDYTATLIMCGTAHTAQATTAGSHMYGTGPKIFMDMFMIICLVAKLDLTCKIERRMKQQPYTCTRDGLNVLYPASLNSLLSL
jgi:hypothetical protein